MAELASEYLILWASQTGSAEWIAKNIHTEAQSKGYTGQCVVMDDYESVSFLPLFYTSILTSVIGTSPESWYFNSHFFQHRRWRCS